MFKKYKFNTRGIGIISDKHISKDSYIGNYFSKIEPITLDSRLIYEGWVETNPLGRYINHNRTPNCDLLLDDNLIKIYSNKNINQFEELTINYLNVIKLIELPMRLINKYGVYDFDYIEEEIIIKQNLI